MKIHETKRVVGIVFVALLAFLVFASKEDLNLSIAPTKNTNEASVSKMIKNAEPNERERAFVDEVLDGDSFTTKDGREIRLIGIDAPELTQPYSEKSKKFLKGFISNQIVELEKDITNKDRYGRFLRNVYLNDTFVNLELVKWGYANIYTYPPNTKYEEDILEAENEAKIARRGFWAETTTTNMVE